MTVSAFGKRYSVRTAAEYLDITEGRLRRLVAQRLIAHATTGAVTTVRRSGGAVQYTRVGRVEFFQRDLDAYLEAQRVPAEPAARPATQLRAIDVEMGRRLRAGGTR